MSDTHFVPEKHHIYNSRATTLMRQTNFNLASGATELQLTTYPYYDCFALTLIHRDTDLC